MGRHWAYLQSCREPRTMSVAWIQKTGIRSWLVQKGHGKLPSQGDQYDTERARKLVIHSHEECALGNIKLFVGLRMWWGCGTKTNKQTPSLWDGSGLKSACCQAWVPEFELETCKVERGNWLHKAALWLFCPTVACSCSTQQVSKRNNYDKPLDLIIRGDYAYVSPFYLRTGQTRSD